MDLPTEGSQDELVRSVAAVNKNTIVVNSTGSPISMPWIEDVAAVVQAWFTGQEAGHSAIEDAPSYGNFPYTGDLKDLRKEYAEGVLVGYKHYDRPNSRKPLFPFGYGLSYTTFEVSNVKVSKGKLSASDILALTMTLRNTGSVNGSETVQVYVGPKGPQKVSVERPQKTLAGFAKVRDLEPRQTEEMRVELSVQESFSYWDEGRRGWVVPEGKYSVFVATSSAESHVVAEIEVDSIEDGESPKL